MGYRPHPLLWIGLTLWITTLAVIIVSISQLLLLLCISLIFVYLSRGKQIAHILLSIKRLFPLFVTLILIQSLLRRGGDTLLSWGILRFSSEGLLLGILVSLRLLILLFSASILGRLSYPDFRNAFMYLPEELAFMISYVVHLIPGIRREYIRYLKVLSWRGIEMKSEPFRTRLHLFKVISLSVLSGLLSGSTMQAVSLELRGFRRSGKKTFLDKQNPCLTDYILLAELALLLVTYLILS